MKLSPDDPKLTAYALGELDRAEAAAIEQEVKNSPELRAAVAEIRATAEFLKTEFATEEKLSLSEQQKQTIAAGLPPTNVIPMPKQRIAVFISVSAIAACVMFTLAWGLWSGTKNQPMASAPNDSEFKYAQNAVNAEKQKIQDDEKTPHSIEIPSPGVAPTPKAAEEPTVIINNPAAVSSVGDWAMLARTSENRSVPPPTPEDSIRRETTKAFELSAKHSRTAPLASTGGAAVDLRPAPVADISQNSVQSVPTQNYLNYAAPKLAETPYRGIQKVKQLSDKTKNQETYQWHLNGRVDGAATVSASTRGFYDDNGSDVWDERRERSGKHGRVQSNYGLYSTARYPQYIENSFESVRNAPLSTVSIDVDTASYANVRRFLNQNQMPPQDAVRIEELVNYFSYDYPQPHGSDPFSVNMEVAGCPWNKQHQIVRVALKGKEIAQDKRPPSNFVFLIDVSGSMSPQERLPLIKQALRMLVKKMTENDRVAMVVYASSSGVVLESTSCVNKEKILEAIDRLEAGGSTNGGQGIQKAYALAEENFIKSGVNRVILATDGDFNVGITDQNQLIDLIQKKAKSGVFLTTLGVGTDNYKDALLQKLADKGNGNYHYLDTLEEAEKVLIQQMNGTLVTIAKDVKIQIEFNPARVQSYRLIGYEKRIMEAQDFNNDKKDAGEIGAGHTVTALYEIVPVGVEDEEPRPAVDDLKYQSKPHRLTPKPEARDRRELRSDDSDELLTLKLRYKKPDGNTSKLLEFPLKDEGKKFANASSDFRFATSVAGFGMLLKNSEYRGTLNYQKVHELAARAKGDDKEGYRAEFINLVKKAESLDRNGE